MKTYQVELTNNHIINVPADKARSNYEHISIYGLGAVLERVRRSRAFKTANKTSDVFVRFIICPNGDRVSQF